MLSHDDLSRLREHHPAWRLLRAANVGGRTIKAAQLRGAA